MSDNKLDTININDIAPDPSQPRQSFDENKLEELAQSIDEYGLMQPITVRQENDGYIIVAGERRWRACQLLEHDEIQAFVVEDNAEANDILAMQVIENMQREDLPQEDEDRAIVELYNKMNETEIGVTYAQIARMVGKSGDYVSDAISRHSLDEEVRSEIYKVGKSYIRAVKKFDEPERQLEFIKRIKKDDLKRDEAIKVANSIIEGEKSIDSFIEDLEQPSTEELDESHDTPESPNTDEILNGLGSPENATEQSEESKEVEEEPVEETQDIVIPEEDAGESEEMSNRDKARTLMRHAGGFIQMANDPDFIDEMDVNSLGMVEQIVEVLSERSDDILDRIEQRRSNNLRVIKD